MIAQKKILLGLLMSLGITAIAPVYAFPDIKTIAGITLFTSLLLLFRKKADPNFAENADARFNSANNTLYKAWYVYDDFIIGQVEKEALVIVANKNIRLSKADAAGILGTICSEVEPFVDASKNLLFLAAFYTFITSKTFTLSTLKAVSEEL